MNDFFADVLRLLLRLVLVAVGFVFFLSLLAAALVLAVLTDIAINRTKFGRGIRAVAQDPVTATLMAERLDMGLRAWARDVGLLARFGAFAQQPIVIKFSHVVAANTPKGKGAEFFAQKANELTKGKVKVEVYANSTLYKDKEEMEALQLGAVQMLAPSLAKFGPLGVKEFEMFDLPYIFDNYDQLHKITEGPIGKSILAKLEPKGIRGLGYWDNGFKSFSANVSCSQNSGLFLQSTRTMKHDRA